MYFIEQPHGEIEDYILTRNLPSLSMGSNSTSQNSPQCPNRLTLLLRATHPEWRFMTEDTQYDWSTVQPIMASHIKCGGVRKTVISLLRGYSDLSPLTKEKTRNLLCGVSIAALGLWWWYEKDKETSTQGKYTSDGISFCGTKCPDWLTVICLELMRNRHRLWLRLRGVT